MIGETNTAMKNNRVSSPIATPNAGMSAFAIRSESRWLADALDDLDQLVGSVALLAGEAD
jgi:hypothetical protein